MLGITFLLYLLSGYIKGILQAFGYHSPVDLTLLTGILTLLFAGFEVFKRGVPEMAPKKDIPLFLLLGGFYAWCLTSAFFLSPSDTYGPWKNVLFLTNILAFLIPSLKRKNFKFQGFLTGFCCFSLLYGGFSFFLYGLAGIRGGENPIGFVPEAFLDSLYLRAGMLLAIGAFLSLHFQSPRTRLVLFNGHLLLLLATAARGPILFFFLSLLLFGGLWAAKNQKERDQGETFPFLKKRILKIGGMILLANGAYVGIVSNSAFLSAPYERTAFRFQVLLNWDEAGSGETEKSEVQAKRTEQWKFAARKIVKSPYHFLLGHGFGSFNLLMYGEDKRGYPHNIFLETAFELGLVGFFLILLFLGKALRECARKRHYILLITLLFILMNTMKSYSMVDLRLMFGLLAFGVFLHGSVLSGPFGKDKKDRDPNHPL